MRPSDRLYRILCRLSRNTWLMPDVVARVSVRFAKKVAPGSWGAVVATVPHHAMHVGLIRGQPAAHPFDRRSYSQMLELSKSNRITTEQKLINALKIQSEVGVL